MPRHQSCNSCFGLQNLQSITDYSSSFPINGVTTFRKTKQGMWTLRVRYERIRQHTVCTKLDKNNNNNMTLIEMNYEHLQTWNGGHHITYMHMYDTIRLHFIHYTTLLLTKSVYNCSVGSTSCTLRIVLGDIPFSSSSSKGFCHQAAQSLAIAAALVISPFLARTNLIQSLSVRREDTSIPTASRSAATWACCSSGS
jgi:hypothetical protein